MGFLRTRSGLPASPATSKASGRPTEAHRWVHEECDRRQGQERALQSSYALRHPDAFKPRGYDGWLAAWVDCGEILDPREIQGRRGAQAENQSDASSD